MLANIPSGVGLFDKFGSACSARQVGPNKEAWRRWEQPTLQPNAMHCERRLSRPVAPGHVSRAGWGLAFWPKKKKFWFGLRLFFSSKYFILLCSSFLGTLPLFFCNKIAPIAISNGSF